MQIYCHSKSVYCGNQESNLLPQAQPRPQSTMLLQQQSLGADVWSLPDRVSLASIMKVPPDLASL